MSEVTPARSRRQRRQAVKRQLESLEPGLRLVAEEVLADVATVDWLGVDASGRAVLVLIAEEGEDLAAFTRALAARAWAAPRVRDWAQLAPPLRFQADAPVRALLVAPSFDPDTTTAAVACGDLGVELALHKPPASDLEDPIEIEMLGAATARPPEPRPAAVVPSFRSGLSDADLGLSPEEQEDFASPPHED